MKVVLLAHTPEPEKVVAAAAKLCYSSSAVTEIMDELNEENTAKFINMLMNIGHESPVEHVTFTFGIEGVSRSLLAQITRHRMASYSVKSQRYVAEGNFEYITPPEIENIPEAREIFHAAMQRDREDYNKLTEILKSKYISEGVDEKPAQKKAIEDARFVLANACETKMTVTMNARSLYNFFRIRCCERAQWEIRALADEMLRLVKEVAPVLFKNAGPSCVAGACPEGKMSCGKAAEKRKSYVG